MGLIPPLTTLRVEDFDPDQRSWLPRLFNPLNQFFTSVSNVINGSIQFGSNIPAQDQALTFTYSGSAQRFSLGISLAPKVVLVGQAFEAGVGIAILPIWQFNASNKVLSIDFKKADGTDLTMGTAYQVFLRVIP